ncbi:hypothetical protein GH733_004682, partial [Mirounga leonina]
MMKYPEFRAGVSVYGIVKDSEDVHSLKNPTGKDCVTYRIKSKKFIIATERKALTFNFLYEHSERIWRTENMARFLKSYYRKIFLHHQVSLLTQKLKKHCKVEYQIKTFSGQTHGFVHRKREDCSAEDKPYIDEARRNLLEWLHKY